MPNSYWDPVGFFGFRVVDPGSSLRCAQDDGVGITDGVGEILHCVQNDGFEGPVDVEINPWSKIDTAYFDRRLK